MHTVLKTLDRAHGLCVSKNDLYDSGNCEVRVYSVCVCHGVACHY